MAKKYSALLSDAASRLNRGLSFGFWTPLDKVDTEKGMAYQKINCRCFCGKEKPVAFCHLAYGRSKSCGCDGSLLKKLYAERGIRIGSYVSTGEYRSWKSMIERCYIPRTKSYSHYGGKGIEVCDRWLNSFDAFVEDIGLKPSSDYSIDRIDNAKGYFKENCRWATPREQCNNKTSNKIISLDGQEKTLSQWSEEKGIPRDTISLRLKRGWSISDALNKPIGAKVLPRPRKVKVFVAGKETDLMDLSKESGISYASLWEMIFRRGICADEAIAKLSKR